MSTDAPIRITLEQEEDYSFRIRFDDTTIADLMTDEAEPLGKGEGPNPTRLLVSAVANCLSASLLFALRKFKNAPGLIRTEIVADKVRNAAGRWRIPRAEVVIRLSDAATGLEHFDRVLGQFEEFCIVTQSVREGMQVDVRIIDADGTEYVPGGAGKAA